ncbi:transposase, MuDR, MULE transposase domain protein [Tanacetum coccineum]
MTMRDYDENKDEQNACNDGVDENPKPNYHKWEKFMAFKPGIPETPLYKSKLMISKHYNKQTEVEVGNIFDNKEALDLAIRLKALDDGYQFLSKKSALERHPAIALAVHNEFPLAFHVDVQPDAYHKLCQAGPQRGSRAHCPLIRYSYMTLNSVESVNACTVLKRKLPVTMLAETYRAIVQGWYFKLREVAANMRYEITDWVADKVHKRKLKSAAWIVHGVNQYQYQVSDMRFNREVNFETGYCECRKWQLFGIPCGHVIAVIRFTTPPGRKFVGGIVATVDPVELDSFSTDQMKLILTNYLGYDENSPIFLYMKKSNYSFDSGLVPLADAIQDSDMILTYTQTHQN